MNTDIFRYKINFLTVLLILGYTYIHTHLTGSYVDATLDMFYNFTVRIPFAERLLIPLLYRGMSYIFPFSLFEIYFLIELFFVSIAFFILFKLLRSQFSDKQSILLTWLFFLILPLVTIINYRLMDPSLPFAAFAYPYDTPTLFFMFAGILFCLREQWGYFLINLILATLNRESSILLVLLIPSLQWKSSNTQERSLSTLAVLTVMFFMVYSLIHGYILYLLRNRMGVPFDYFIYNTNIPRFSDNLYWLFNKNNLLQFMFCFAFLPVFWFVFYDYIPKNLRPIRYVALFNFIILFYVGAFKEARIFLEIVALLYFPVCIAVKQWVENKAPYQVSHECLMINCLDRYGVLSIIFLMLVISKFLL